METNRPTLDIEKSSPQTAILYGFMRPRSEADMDELSLLTGSVGVLVLEEIAQRNDKPHPRHYISPGSVKELKEVVNLIKPDMVIFDCELKGSQRNNIENDIGVQVVDRTELILDIFASRAKTKEGKLQVELAQLLYQLPRLMGMGKRLSALGGGIGTRGPGETKLELDRRRIHQRIARLKREIEEIEQHRSTQRKSRMKSNIPKVALVGYTNAGKSTLLNAVTGSDAYADDRLFATLDPLTRRTFFPLSEREVLFTDTVGFIRRIPTQLIAAFKATLEEIKYADLLILVVDITDSDFREKLAVVNDTLDEIGAGAIPRLTVFNKTDMVDEPPAPKPGEMAISAKHGWGIDELMEKIDRMTSTCPLPYEKTDE